MSRRVLAVVGRGAASTEEVTRKVSMMTSMDIGLCKRWLEEVDLQLELPFLKSFVCSNLLIVSDGT